MKENPISDAAKRGIGIGLALAAGAAAVYYGLRSPASSSSTTQSTTSNAIVPVTGAGSVSLSVNNILSVQLPIGSNIFSYVPSVVSSSSPAPLFEGPSPTLTGTLFTDNWGATAAGTQTISYQAIDSTAKNVGAPVVINVTVTS
jgi:hypothetical protein